jgi:hypothetical protein
MAKGNLSLNSVGYHVIPFERDGHTQLVHRYKIDPLVPGFSEGGPNKLQNLRNVIPLTFPNFMDGFGRDRIDSDSAFVGAEYRRCYYATCDIRWGRQQYLPILEANSTHSTLEVIRASESYKSNLWALWEDVSGAAVLSRKYDGSEVDWIAGGRAGPIPFFDASTESTSDGFTHTVGTKGNRLLLVAALAATEPTAVTYGGVSMVKITQTEIPSGEELGLWKLVAPASGGNTVTLSGESGLTAVHAVSYYNVDQSTPTGTVGVTTGSGTSSAVAATGNGASLIFGVAVANRVLAGAAGQTERENTSNTEHIASADKSGSGATTLTWTLISAGHASIAVPLNSSAVVGLDIHAHKTHLLALCAAADGHVVTRSTDGVTFSLPSTQVTQGLLDNVVTAHEDIDAGLLATVGNEAVAVLWHESNGTITFFSSTNAGDAWTDETIDIASGNGPQGAAVMNGIDNAQKLYVGTREGLYEIDTSPSTWTADLIFPMTANNDNCRRMAVGQDGALWFAQGVDDDTVPIVYRMFTNNGTRQFMKSPNDLSEGDGLPEERLGPIRHMLPVQGMMYVAAGGGTVGETTGRKASIFVHNGRGWSSMRAHDTQNQPIEWMAASGDDDGVPRLHYAVRTATAVSNAKFLKQPFVNPVTGVSVDRESSGFIDMPYVDAGILTSGTWASVRINAENLSESNSNEFINVDYGHDDTSSGGGLHARTNTDLGDFLSGTSLIKFGSGAGVASINMGLRINFARDGGNNTHTPKLKDVQILVKKKAANTQGFWFLVDIEQTSDINDTSTEAVITALETARDLGTFPAFQYSNMTATYVDVLRVEFYDSVDAVGDEAPETVPNTNARRTGFALVNIEEPA